MAYPLELPSTHYNLPQLDVFMRGMHQTCCTAVEKQIAQCVYITYGGAKIDYDCELQCTVGMLPRLLDHLETGGIDTDLIIHFPGMYRLFTKDLFSFILCFYKSVQIYKPYSSDWNTDRIYCVFKNMKSQVMNRTHPAFEYLLSLCSNFQSPRPFLSESFGVI